MSIEKDIELTAVRMADLSQLFKEAAYDLRYSVQAMDAGRKDIARARLDDCHEKIGRITLAHISQE
jgi:uncharacterized protein with PhoU and TrkA domain